MGLLARALRLSGLTHGRRPLFLFAESRRRGTHDTKPHHFSACQSEGGFLDTYRGKYHFTTEHFCILISFHFI
jgi:hypothetical protein